MNEQLKPFQRVLVRDGDDEEWMLNLYSHYDETAIKFNFVCLASRFKNCIPYEGNEALLGTTGSPLPKRWRAEKYGTYWFVNSDGKFYQACDEKEYFDDARYHVGNYFRTREEAEEMATKFKAMLKGE